MEASQDLPLQGDYRGVAFAMDIYQLLCGIIQIKSLLDSTPLKTNMEPKNGGLEDDFPFQLGDF